MTQNNIILQELLELGSPLPHTTHPVYSIPDGYFEGLANQVLNKIKALEADNAADELSFLSPLLAEAPKQMPYAVPADYFTGLEERMMKAVRTDDTQTAQEELESISPLLSSLKKETPYQVPAGYFQGLNTTINEEKQTAEPVAKVITMTSRKWFRYGAAAVIVGIIASALVLVFKSSSPAKDLAKFEKKLNKEIKKTSDKELAEFIEFTDAGQDVAVNVPKEEVKELLKDVPATELQQFLDEIADPETSDDENVSMEE